MEFNLFTILNNILNESVSQNDVIQALNDKRVIMITYNDEQDDPPLGKRWIEPCSLVDMDGHGKLAIRAYAYAGATRRGVPDWKLFRLDRIQSWTPTNSKFIKAPDNRYNPNGDAQYHVIQQIHFDNQNSDLIQRNIDITKQEKNKKGIDSFGRKLKNQQNMPQPNQQGPINPQNSVNNLVNNNNPNNNNVQSGPIDNVNFKHDWKKFRDLLYQKNKRDKIKADKLRQQTFSDADEEEMMNKFNTGKLFDDDND